jgi:hypothetical protein
MDISFERSTDAAEQMQPQASGGSGTAEGAGGTAKMMFASRSLSVGILDNPPHNGHDHIAGVGVAAAECLAEARRMGGLQSAYSPPSPRLSHSSDDAASQPLREQLAWQLANRYTNPYTDLPNVYRGRASTAVGARGGGGGLRLKGKGGTGAGMLQDYSTFGISPGEIRRMSVNHVGCPRSLVHSLSCPSSVLYH